MQLKNCNDGRCPRTRKGEKIHAEHQVINNFWLLSRRQPGISDLLALLSLMFLIVGALYGFVVFVSEGSSQFEFASKCVYEAIYENATSEDYQECVIDGMKDWSQLLYVHMISIIALVAAAVCALLRR